MGREIVLYQFLFDTLQTVWSCDSVPQLPMTDSSGLELTRMTHGSSLEDDIDLEVESESDVEGSRSPVTEKKNIDNGDDFDDVEGV